MKIYKYLNEEKDIEKKIIQFFKSNSNPSDDDIHSFAEKEGIDPHEFEEYIYKLLGSLVRKL